MRSLVSKANQKTKRGVHRGKSFYEVMGTKTTDHDDWAEYKEIMCYAEALAKGGMTGITEDGDARSQLYSETH